MELLTVGCSHSWCNECTTPTSNLCISSCYMSILFDEEHYSICNINNSTCSTHVLQYYWYNSGISQQRNMLYRARWILIRQSKMEFEEKFKASNATKNSFPPSVTKDFQSDSRNLNDFVFERDEFPFVSFSLKDREWLHTPAQGQVDFIRDLNIKKYNELTNLRQRVLLWNCQRVMLSRE